MSDEASRVSIRKGGEVDGEQYYVLSATDSFGEHSSAAIPEGAVRDYLDKCERVLSGELNYGAVEVDTE